MLPLLLAALMAAQDPIPDRPPPVAMVVEVTGKPTRLVAGVSKPARRLDMLRAGDRVASGTGGGLTIVFVSNGHLEKLSEGASIVVREVGGGDVKGKVERLPSTLSEPNLKALREKLCSGTIGGGVFRSGDPPRPAVGPVDGTVVPTAKPTLRWAAVAGAARYRVELLSGAAIGGEKILWTREASATELPYPVDAPGLTRLRLYRWRVSVVTADGNESLVIKESRFLVGPAELEAQAAALTKLVREGDPAEQLLAAVVLESLGLLDELYPFYTRLAERAESDPNLWVKAADCAGRAGRPQEAATLRARRRSWAGSQIPSDLSERRALITKYWLVAVAALGLAGPVALAQPFDAPTAGAESVEAMLQQLVADGAIVPARDPKTGKVVEDPNLGVPRFEVLGTTALQAAVKTHRGLMKEQKSRMALIGCAKLASPPSVPGWTALLRAVGHEWDDWVSVQISYEIAAKHGPMPLSQAGLASLQRFVNRALEADVLEFHQPEKGGRRALTVKDAARLRELIDAHRGELGPDTVNAALIVSKTRIDHSPLLRAIGERLSDPVASAYAAEFAAQNLLSNLKPEAAVVELETAAKGFEALHDTPSKARVLIALARTRRELGQYELALEHLRVARKILDVVHDGKHSDIALVLKSVAEIHLERGEVQRRSSPIWNRSSASIRCRRIRWISQRRPMSFGCSPGSTFAWDASLRPANSFRTRYSCSRRRRRSPGRPTPGWRRRSAFVTLAGWTLLRRG